MLNSLELIKGFTTKINTVNILDVNGLSILHYAVMNERVSIVKYLISQGADLNTTTKDQGRSPLYSAYMNGNRMIIAMLKIAGAKVIKDKYGWYPENGK